MSTFRFVARERLGFMFDSSSSSTALPPAAFAFAALEHLRFALRFGASSFASSTSTRTGFRLGQSDSGDSSRSTVAILLVVSEFGKPETGASDDFQREVEAACW